MLDISVINRYVQIFYYAGAGVILFGTGVRFLYRFIRKRDKRGILLDELEALDIKLHLLQIYTALNLIADKLNIELPIGPQEEEDWLIKRHPRQKFPS